MRGSFDTQIYSPGLYQSQSNVQCKKFVQKEYHVKVLNGIVTAAQAPIVNSIVNVVM